ncbi:hypothetical protein GCM10022419_013510 [Nonomuraea rosea]|uniref:Uncharacterized protein n=1 Tax=Nonomuraea rosea TaxID=638574 RepID=A0ABP6VHP9_9ACTN
MNDDDAFVSAPLGDDALLLGVGLQVLLILLPTVIWLSVTLLRGRKQRLRRGPQDPG